MRKLRKWENWIIMKIYSIDVDCENFFRTIKVSFPKIPDLLTFVIYKFP